MQRELLESDFPCIHCPKLVYVNFLKISYQPEKMHQSLLCIKMQAQKCRLIFHVLSQHKQLTTSGSPQTKKTVYGIWIASKVNKAGLSNTKVSSKPLKWNSQSICDNHRVYRSVLKQFECYCVDRTGFFCLLVRLLITLTLKWVLESSSTSEQQVH